MGIPLRQVASLTLAVAIAAVLPGPPTVLAQETVKTCKLKTKTMGCAVETGLGDVSAAARATVVAAGGPLPGKCQIDSPGVATVKEQTIAIGVFCNDPALADTGDTMIGLCKTAANTARANCKTICSKLEKIDSSTGDPIPETPCHVVVDRTVVTTTSENLGPRTNDDGETGCGLECAASIVCVCDP